MPALFLDENVKVELADSLKEEGISVYTTRDQGRLGANDADQLLYCATHGWALVTQNRRDFLALHEGWVTWTTAWKRSSEHGGILVLDQGPLIPELVAAIVPFLASGKPLINRLWNWYDNPPEWQEFTVGGSRKRRSP